MERPILRHSNPTQLLAEINVGPIFNGDAAFALTEGGSEIAKFSSREDVNAPQLVFDEVTDSQPPSVQLVQPVAGKSLRGTIDLVAAAADSGGIDRVEFWRDGVKLGLGSRSLDGIRNHLEHD